MTDVQGTHLPRHGAAQLFLGMTYPLRALAFIQRHGLWRLALLPIIVNIALLLALSLLGWYGVWPWLQNLQERLQGMSGDGDVIRGAVTLLVWALWLVLAPLTFILCTVVVCLTGHVVASPFLDMLSERTETLVLGTPAVPFGVRRLFDAIFVAVGDVLWGMLYLGFVYVPLLLLSFIPGLGGILSLGVGALLLSQEFVGLPMARHLVSYRARWRLILYNRWFCIGFGSVATMLVVTPGLNLILLPLACVGGTLLYCDLYRDDRLHLATALARRDGPADK